MEDDDGDGSYALGMILVLILLCRVILWFVGAAGVEGAPAPKYVAPAAIVVGPGEWAMDWGGTPEPLVLDAEGRSSWGSDWAGTYHYDPKTMTYSGEDWRKGSEGVVYRWSVVLDDAGRGVSAGGHWAGTRVRIYRPLKAAPRPTD